MTKDTTFQQGKGDVKCSLSLRLIHHAVGSAAGINEEPMERLNPSLVLPWFTCQIACASLAAELYTGLALLPPLPCY